MFLGREEIEIVVLDFARILCGERLLIFGNGGFILEKICMFLPC